MLAVFFQLKFMLLLFSFAFLISEYLYYNSMLTATEIISDPLFDHYAEGLRQRKYEKLDLFSFILLFLYSLACRLPSDAVPDCFPQEVGIRRFLVLFQAKAAAAHWL